MALTELQVKNAKPTEKNYTIRDEKNLYLYVTPSGKYWIFRGWKDGKEFKKSLGSYPQVSLKDARVKRDEINAARARGEDPFIKSAKSSETFKDILNDWLDVKMSGNSEGYLRVINLRISKYILPELAGRKITEITSGDILRLCRSIEATGKTETARRIKIIIGQVFRFAIATDRAETDSTLAIAGALAPASGRHYAAITEPDRIAHLIRTIQAYPYPLLRYAMLFSALTFARPGEVRRAEWQEISLDRQEWRIPAEKMKMKRPHIVPLASQTLDLLLELKNITGCYRWLFPSARSDSRPMSENAVRVALRSMGFTNDEMTAHGFRAMASTTLHENGFQSEVIEIQLAHAEKNAVKAAYNHAEYLPERRKLMQWYADFLLKTEV